MRCLQLRSRHARSLVTRCLVFVARWSTGARFRCWTAHDVDRPAGIARARIAHANRWWHRAATARPGSHGEFRRDGERQHGKGRQQHAVRQWPNVVFHRGKQRDGDRQAEQKSRTKIKQSPGRRRRACFHRIQSPAAVAAALPPAERTGRASQMMPISPRNNSADTKKMSLADSMKACWSISWFSTW